MNARATSNQTQQQSAVDVLSDAGGRVTLLDVMLIIAITAAVSIIHLCSYCARHPYD